LGEPRNSTWVAVHRRAGANLEVMFDIVEDDSLPATHPLQMFHPRRWPFGDQLALRKYFEQHLEVQRRAVDGLLLALEYAAATAEHGYKIHSGDTARMQQMVVEFGAEFRLALATARVVAAAPLPRGNIVLRLIRGGG
jgi:hypothetical protein